MPAVDFTQPFPDYVACPNCGEPEVEVWCYELRAKCHACGREFTHPVPRECGDTCTDAVRAWACEVTHRPAKGTCISVRAGDVSNAP